MRKGCSTAYRPGSGDRAKRSSTPSDLTAAPVHPPGYGTFLPRRRPDAKIPRTTDADTNAPTNVIPAPCRCASPPQVTCTFPEDRVHWRIEQQGYERYGSGDRAVDCAFRTEDAGSPVHPLVCRHLKRRKNNQRETLQTENGGKCHPKVCGVCGGAAVKS